MNYPARKGVSLIYATVMMIVLFAFCAFAVDFGRIQLARNQARQAAEAASRAGAEALSRSPVVVRNQAIDLATRNRILESSITANQTTVEIGYWNSVSRTFTAIANGIYPQANAVRVTIERSRENGSPIPMVFASVLGHENFNVRASSIAMMTPPIEVEERVDGRANPFLAGMPEGSIASVNNPHRSPDFAGNPNNRSRVPAHQSPFAIQIPITPGESLTFDSIDGTTRHDPNLAYYAPDGEDGSASANFRSVIGHNTNSPDWRDSYSNSFSNENGIADMRGPINALVGVFLTDEAPNRSGVPSNLDFSSAQSRDFSTLRPQIKQIFFIGDGLNSRGSQQRFEVPEGATRLYLATWDFYEWNNNWGTRIVKVSRPGRIVTVQ